MIAGDEWVISHGDALCTNDLSYQIFRKWVRKPWLQNLFLRLPLEWRRSIARTLRSNSTAKYDRAARYTPEMARFRGDVTLAACANLMGSYGSERLIHGHTHLPARHHESMGNKEWQRWVLSDWDLDHPETVLPKASALRIDINGVRYIDLVKTS
jgi:UDP-2,3-diacylglucosamine hydrolase